MNLSGRGRGLFDAILGPHTEDEVEAGLIRSESLAAGLSATYSGCAPETVLALENA
jgi:hypothetical protein